MIRIFGYIDGVPTSIKENVLKLYFEDKKREHILSTSQLNYWITEKICIDKEIYQTVTEIFNQKTFKK